MILNWVVDGEEIDEVRVRRWQRVRMRDEGRERWREFRADDAAATAAAIAAISGGGVVAGFGLVAVILLVWLSR